MICYVHYWTLHLRQCLIDSRCQVNDSRNASGIQYIILQLRSIETGTASPVDKPFPIYHRAFYDATYDPGE